MITFLTNQQKLVPTEVARALSLKKSTAFRLLSSLNDIQFLDKSPETGKYRLGLRFVELGLVTQDRLDLRREALPHLRRLAEQTGLTTFLCVRDGFKAVCLERIPGLQVAVLELRPGRRPPLHMGSAPRVLLAALKSAELNEFLLTGFSKATPYTMTEPDQIRRDIEQTRRQGYVLSREDGILGIGAVGAPIYDAPGRVVASLSVSGLVGEFTDDKVRVLLTNVLRAADDISDRLGYKPDVST